MTGTVYFAAIIIPGQRGTYLHLPGRVTDLLADSGLNTARREGRIKVHYLGTGLDALNFVGDALTVAVFDADTFDDIFRDMVSTNEKGTVAKDGKTLENYIFDNKTIDQILAAEAIAPSGAACLALACKYYDTLLP